MFMRFIFQYVEDQAVNKPSVENGSILEVAPGERYDIAFTADSGKNFMIDDHTDMAGAKYMKIEVAYTNNSDEEAKHPKATDTVNLMDLGEKAEVKFSLNDIHDVEYTMDLGSKMDMEKSMAYTINGAAYPDVPPLKVEKGDFVKKYNFKHFRLKKLNHHSFLTIIFYNSNIRGCLKSHKMINGEFLHFACLSSPHVGIAYILVLKITPPRTSCF